MPRIIPVSLLILLLLGVASFAQAKTCKWQVSYLAHKRVGTNYSSQEIWDKLPTKMTFETGPFYRLKVSGLSGKGNPEALKLVWSYELDRAAGDEVYIGSQKLVWISNTKAISSGWGFNTAIASTLPEKSGLLRLAVEKDGRAVCTYSIKIIPEE